VQDCLNLGFGLQDIVVLTGRGRESSQVLNHSHLGPWALRKASGQRDADGQELLSPGVLLCETVHRFKGQAVGAVVLTELEFGTAQDPGAELRWHRLYVGLTRAQAHVGLVMGEEAARAVGAVGMSSIGDVLEDTSVKDFAMVARRWLKS